MYWLFLHPPTSRTSAHRLQTEPIQQVTSWLVGLPRSPHLFKHKCCRWIELPRKQLQQFSFLKSTFLNWEVALRTLPVDCPIGRMQLSNVSQGLFAYIRDAPHTLTAPSGEKDWKMFSTDTAGMLPRKQEKRLSCD